MWCACVFIYLYILAKERWQFVLEFSKEQSPAVWWFCWCVANADVKAAWRSMISKAGTGRPLSLFSLCPASCNSWLWNLEREFSASLQFWYEFEAVIAGKQPRGSIAATAIFFTPSPWMRFRFRASWLITDLVKFGKP